MQSHSSFIAMLVFTPSLRLTAMSKAQSNAKATQKQHSCIQCTERNGTEQVQCKIIQRNAKSKHAPVVILRVRSGSHSLGSLHTGVFPNGFPSVLASGQSVLLLLAWFPGKGAKSIEGVDIIYTSILVPHQPSSPRGPLSKQAGYLSYHSTVQDWQQ